MYTTVESRAEYVLNKLLKNKLLNLPDWTDEELEELSGSLRASVLQGLLAKEKLLKRINHLQTVVNVQ